MLFMGKILDAISGVVVGATLLSIVGVVTGGAALGLYDSFVASRKLAGTGYETSWASASSDGYLRASNGAVEIPVDFSGNVLVPYGMHEIRKNKDGTWVGSLGASYYTFNEEGRCVHGDCANLREYNKECRSDYKNPTGRPVCP